MEQFEFEFLDKKEKYNFDDFIIFSSNNTAYSFLIENEFESLSYNVIFLTGPQKSGKTYLAYLWKIKKNAKFLDFNSLLKLSDIKFNEKLLNIIEKYDYYVIDNFNVNKINENKLFHLINIILANHSKLLIITDNSIYNYEFKIKDLKSRINSSIHLQIEELTEEYKGIFILKLISNKQIRTNDQAIKYIINILKPNYAYIYEYIESITQLAKKEKKRITLQFLKKINLF